jgi:hypothetical protein
MKPHGIVDLVFVVKFEELYFLVNKIFIAFEKLGEEDRHSLWFAAKKGLRPDESNLLLHFGS